MAYKPTITFMAKQVLELQCFICTQSYNQSNRKPIQICQNQHFCCSRCTYESLLPKFTKCSMCSSPLFNKNDMKPHRFFIEIIRLLPELSKNQKQKILELEEKLNASLNNKQVQEKIKKLQKQIEIGHKSRKQDIAKAEKSLEQKILVLQDKLRFYENNQKIALDRTKKLQQQILRAEKLKNKMINELQQQLQQKLSREQNLLQQIQTLKSFIEIQQNEIQSLKYHLMELRQFQSLYLEKNKQSCLTSSTLSLKLSKKGQKEYNAEEKKVSITEKKQKIQNESNFFQFDDEQKIQKQWRKDKDFINFNNNQNGILMLVLRLYGQQANNGIKQVISYFESQLEEIKTIWSISIYFECKIDKDIWKRFISCLFEQYCLQKMTLEIPQSHFQENKAFVTQSIVDELKKIGVNVDYRCI